MYARISRKTVKGTTYEYLQLCEAYRDKNGSPRNRILYNFGRIDQLDRKKVDSAINALLKFSSDPSPTRLSDVEHGSVKDYGDILALVHLWAWLRLTESITEHLKENKVEFDVAKMVQVMVLNRISDPRPHLILLRGRRARGSRSRLLQGQAA
jgi:hypothetical protein